MTKSQLEAIIRRAVSSAQSSSVTASLPPMNRVSSVESSHVSETDTTNLPKKRESLQKLHRLSHRRKKKTADEFPNSNIVTRARKYSHLVDFGPSKGKNDA
jgi:hypothetical protein